MEHRIWFDSGSGRVIKITHPGRFGRTVRLISPRPEAARELYRLVRFADASPLEYLDRLALHDELFGRSVRVLGVVRDDGSKLSMVISQVFLHGMRPTDAEVRLFLTSDGFRQLGFEPAYYRSRDRMAVFDAHSANFVRTGGHIVPFDAITLRVAGEMEKSLNSFVA